MRTSRLCVTVTAATTAELRARRDQVADADLVELRVDTVRDPDAAAALADRRTPVIFTCRPTWEGGHFEGSEEERHRILQDARQLGAEYVDVEWKAGFTDLLTSNSGRGVIVSAHDFDGVPADLTARYAAMRASGAEVVKLAVMAGRLTDCLPLLSLRKGDARPVVLLAMGEAGAPTRILASRFGSAWTYAGDGVAPGQMPARQAAARARLPPRATPARRSTASSGARSCIRCRRRCTTRRSKRPGSTRCMCRSRPPRTTTSCSLPMRSTFKAPASPRPTSSRPSSQRAQCDSVGRRVGGGEYVEALRGRLGGVQHGWRRLSRATRSQTRRRTGCA